MEHNGYNLKNSMIFIILTRKYAKLCPVVHSVSSTEPYSGKKHKNFVVKKQFVLVCI